MGRKTSSQIEALEKRQEQTKARLQNLRSRQERIEKAKETRRLVLAGQAFFKMCGSDWDKVAARLRDGNILKAKDRELFASTANSNLLSKLNSF